MTNTRPLSQSQSYTYPPVPQSPTASASANVKPKRPPNSKSNSRDDALGTNDSSIALYSDGESDHNRHSHPPNNHNRERSGSGSNTSLPTALKVPESGSKNRTVLVQGSQAEGVYPSEETESASTDILAITTLANPLLGLGEERVKLGVPADPTSIRKLAWGDRPEMSFVLDDGSGVNAQNGTADDSDNDSLNAESNPCHQTAADNGVVIVGGGADKRKRYTTAVENGKKRKVIDITSFHPALHPLFDQLRAAIAAESWEVKGRFPQSIKPILAQVALTAIKLDEYDDHFFSSMPTLFMYNKFTMTKLIKCTVFAEHTAMIVERHEALLTQLKKEADEGFTRAEEEWERSVVAWDKRQKKAKANTALPIPGGGTAGSGAESASNAPTRNPSPLDDPEHKHDHDDEDIIMQDASKEGSKDGR
ncbi:hypothetical protein VKT23_017656 [Stygiomarasmius scandens]|uniref:Ubinuclein middle domain-containing protein n=1 Tax=Marasmiellus scandens TaxID=2682957 RepID=A0ABR1IVQ3_9AGAR